MAARYLSKEGLRPLSSLDIGHPFASRVPKIGWTAGEVVTSGWLVATYRSIMPQSATYHGTFTRALHGSYLNDTATANGNESTVGIVFKVIRFVWDHPTMSLYRYPRRFIFYLRQYFGGSARGPGIFNLERCGVAKFQRLDRRNIPIYVDRAK